MERAGAVMVRPALGVTDPRLQRMVCHALGVIDSDYSGWHPMMLAPAGRRLNFGLNLSIYKGLTGKGRCLV